MIADSTQHGPWFADSAPHGSWLVDSILACLMVGGVNYVSILGCHRNQIRPMVRGLNSSWSAVDRFDSACPVISRLNPTWPTIGPIQLRLAGGWLTPPRMANGWLARVGVIVVGRFNSACFNWLAESIQLVQLLADSTPHGQIWTDSTPHIQHVPCLIASSQHGQWLTD